MFNQRRLERLTRQVILMIYGQLNDYKVRLWKLVLYTVNFKELIQLYWGYFEPNFTPN